MTFEQVLRRLFGTVGFVSGLFCLFMIVSAVSELTTGVPSGSKPVERGVLWGLLVFFGGALYGCYRLVRYGFSNESIAPPDKPKKMTPEQWEGRILQFARQQKGRLTVALVAAEFDELDLDDSEKWLNTMVEKGVAHQDISPEGMLSYLFPDFTPATHG